MGPTLWLVILIRELVVLLRLFFVGYVVRRKRFASNGFVARFQLHEGTRATHMPEQIDVRNV